MKKLWIIILLGMATVGAKADIAVNWSSDSWFSPFGVVPGLGENPTANPASFIPANAYHVLIWSMSAPPTGAYAQAGDGLGAGEVAIWDSTQGLRVGDTRGGGGEFNYTPGGEVVLTDAQAGGTATAGYVYSRIFSNSTVSVGDWYYQSESYLSPGLDQYDADPPGILTHTTSAFGIYGDRTMGDGTGMYQVIPEPGTLMFSLSALGVLAVRRLRQRN